MSKFSERGYIVKECGPIYFTSDMEKTIKWFEDILGWYSSIDERDVEGKGVYGCVFSITPEVEITHLAPFTGIHLMRGESRKGALSLMQVKGIESLYQYVIKNGYDRISKVEMQSWGAKLCSIETIDGYELRFFE